MPEDNTTPRQLLQLFTSMLVSNTYDPTDCSKSAFLRPLSEHQDRASKDKSLEKPNEALVKKFLTIAALIGSTSPHSDVKYEFGAHRLFICPTAEPVTTFNPDRVKELDPGVAEYLSKLPNHRIKLVCQNNKSCTQYADEMKAFATAYLKSPRTSG